MIGDMSDVDVVSYSSGSRRESTSAIELRRHRQLQGSNYICRLWHAWKIPRARNSDFRASFWRLSTDQAALAVRANIGIGRQTGHTKRTRIPGGYKLVGRLKHICPLEAHVHVEQHTCMCMWFQCVRRKSCVGDASYERGRTAASKQCLNLQDCLSPERRLVSFACEVRVFVHEPTNPSVMVRTDGRTDRDTPGGMICTKKKDI